MRQILQFAKFDHQIIIPRFQKPTPPHPSSPPPTHLFQYSVFNECGGLRGARRARTEGHAVRPIAVASPCRSACRHPSIFRSPESGVRNGVTESRLGCADFIPESGVRSPEWSHRSPGVPTLFRSPESGVRSLEWSHGVQTGVCRLYSGVRSPESGMESRCRHWGVYYKIQVTSYKLQVTYL